MPKTYCPFCGLRHRHTDELTCRKRLVRVTRRTTPKSQAMNISNLTMATAESDDSDELSQLTHGVKEVNLDEHERSISIEIECLEKEERITILEERCRKLLE